MEIFCVSVCTVSLTCSENLYQNMHKLDDKLRGFVQKHCANYDASHDISHIDRVRSNALKILSLSSASVQIVVKRDVLVAIATLHDSFDHKYLTTKELVDEAKMNVTKFLKELQFDEQTIRMIIEVIDKMGFTSEVSGCGGNDHDSVLTQYLHIVQDADRLDAIGAIGISRCLAFSGAFNRPIISEFGTDEKAQRDAYTENALGPVSRKGGSAITHFYDKLVFLKDMLKTPAGKQLGEKRHAFLLLFLDEFFDELN